MCGLVSWWDDRAGQFTWSSFLLVKFPNNTNFLLLLLLNKYWLVKQRWIKRSPEKMRSWWFQIFDPIPRPHPFIYFDSMARWFFHRSPNYRKEWRDEDCTTPPSASPSTSPSAMPSLQAAPALPHAALCIICSNFLAFCASFLRSFHQSECLIIIHIISTELPSLSPSAFFSISNLPHSLSERSDPVLFREYECESMTMMVQENIMFVIIITLSPPFFRFQKHEELARGRWRDLVDPLNFYVVRFSFLKLPIFLNCQFF
jgi:hypothetical protein